MDEIPLVTEPEGLAQGGAAVGRGGRVSLARVERRQTTSGLAFWMDGTHGLLGVANISCTPPMLWVLLMYP